MSGDSSITWRDVIIVVRDVGDSHDERWERWLREAKATAYVDKPELLDEAYSGPAVEGWPLTDSNDSRARRAEILKRLKKAKVVQKPPAGFRFEKWPTDFIYVNQRFGSPGKIYTNAGYPGHEGIDIHARMDTPYYAVAAGTVKNVIVKESEVGYGTYVLIGHKDDYSTLYAHAHARPAPSVKVGKQVAAGQKLAISGNTGRSTKAHLHLTLKKSGHVEPGWGKKPGYMDPGPFLTKLLKKIEPRVNACYIHESHLDIKKNSKAITRPSNLVTYLRDKADKADEHAFSWVPKGTLVRLLKGTPENGFYKCELLAL